MAREQASLIYVGCLGTAKRCVVASLATVATVLALLAPATAGARTITVGSPLAGAYPITLTVLGSSVTLASLTLPGPAVNAASPVDGVVLSWRLVAQQAADAYALHVLHPIGGGQYEGTATSAARIASTTATEIFATRLPIKAGDLIGIDGLKSSPSMQVASAPAKALYWRPAIVDGLPSPAAQLLGGYELGFNAEVQPAPQVALISPPAGSVSGGATVTIAGADFSGVEAVKFGSAPAASYTVDSEAQITAVAPAVVNPGPVDLTVTTIAGTSPAVAGDRFTYNANPVPPPSPPAPPVPDSTCVVPKLVGKKLKAGRRKLKKAGCKLGRVRGKKAKAAKIVKQRPKAGRTLRAGTAVKVWLRARPPRGHRRR